MRVVHYMNQFFGGLGGEESASVEAQIQDGAIGPGRLLEQVLGPDAQVVKTIIAGDNYAAENLEALKELALKEVRDAQTELFIAGPCFEAGRYGLAAGALCAAVQEELGIPAVTGMAAENPGVDLFRQDVYIVDSGESVNAMRDVMTRMVNITNKLLRKEELGLPAEVAAPPPIADLSKARIAIVTDGGLVPKGNPDNISAWAATNWGSYDISQLNDLQGEDYEVSHRGYDTRYVEQDPDRLVPIDALRELEKLGEVGKLHERFISTSGLANPLANSRRLGREIAQQLKDEGVDAVILTSA